MFYRLRNRSELIRQQNAIESGRRRNLTSSSCKERPPRKPDFFLPHSLSRRFSRCAERLGSLIYLAVLPGQYVRPCHLAGVVYQKSLFVATVFAVSSYIRPGVGVCASLG